MPTAIPDDIIFCIVKSLQGETSVLQACALTAQSWYLPARKYLHASITIGKSPRVQGRLEFYKARPDLLDLIEIMEITSHSSDLLATLEGMKFSSLTTLSLVTLTEGQGDTIINLLHQKLPALNSLSIKNATFSKDTFLTFMSHLARLTSLSFSDIHFPKNDGQQTSSSKGSAEVSAADNVPRCLRFIELDYSDGSYAFVKWLRRLAVMPPIEYVMITRRDSRYQRGRKIQTLASALSPKTLKVIHIDKYGRASIQKNQDLRGKTIHHTG